MRAPGPLILAMLGVTKRKTEIKRSDYMSKIFCEKYFSLEFASAACVADSSIIFAWRTNTTKAVVMAMVYQEMLVEIDCTSRKEGIRV